MMDGQGKSDSLIGPTKLRTKRTGAAEAWRKGDWQGEDASVTGPDSEPADPVQRAERIRQAVSREGVRCYHLILLRMALYPRQEPDAVMLHVRIVRGAAREGGSRKVGARTLNFER